MKALILDDEFTAAEYLESLIKRHCPEITDSIATTSVVEASKQLTEGEVDILFTDIEMDEMSGLDLVRSLTDIELPPVIFTTAYNQYAIEAFRANAVDYLLKPVEPKELKESIEKALKSTLSKQNENLMNLLNSFQSLQADRLAIADGQDYHLIKTKDIIRAEGSGSYTTFYLTEGRKYSASKGLKVFIDQLSKQKGFIRTHQSHLVNLEYALTYSKAEGGQLFLREGHNVPVSHRLRQDVQLALGLKGSS